MIGKHPLTEYQAPTPTYDLICFSHLRWNFVFQRPQHLMSRCAQTYRTFFIEEPIFSEGQERLEYNHTDTNVGIVIPYLNPGIAEEEVALRLNKLLMDFFKEKSILHYIFWYYTPMALSFTENFNPQLIIYDCMDELSAFKFAPPRLKELEKTLFNKADLVFTGGVSLYEFKKSQHHNIYPFPSSIDKNHFGQARTLKAEPEDQENIPHPRLGFYGVIDERFDIDLINQVAELKSDWHFVLVGPVVKIDPDSLPKKNNIHYLGGRTYEQLPSYLAKWDIALIPFARNESTRFISPTKTPEYLAAGKPVISTSIKDVVDQYGINGLVHIADTAKEFIIAAESIFSSPDKEKWLRETDAFLAGNSWDKTWTSMLHLINLTLEENKSLTKEKKKESYV